MSCKFKNPANPCHCLMTNGECQFIKNRFDEKCPILHVFQNVQVPQQADNEKQQ